MSGSPSYSFQDHARAAEGAHPSSANGASSDFRRTATRADLLDAVAASCPNLSRTQAREIFECHFEDFARRRAKSSK